MNGFYVGNNRHDSSRAIRILYSRSLNELYCTSSVNVLLGREGIVIYLSEEFLKFESLTSNYHLLQYLLATASSVWA